MEIGFFLDGNENNISTSEENIRMPLTASISRVNNRISVVDLHQFGGERQRSLLAIVKENGKKIPW